MSRPVPHKMMPPVLTQVRTEFHKFVTEVILDTFSIHRCPTTLTLIDIDKFELTLVDYRFNVDILEVDNIYDYINVYLFGVKQNHLLYNVTIVNGAIVITFNTSITRTPNSVISTDFDIYAKIIAI